MVKQLYSSLRVAIYKLKHFNSGVRFLRNSRIDNRCAFEGHNSVGENSRLSNCHLGVGSYIGREVQLSSVKIGRFCSVGSFIRNVTGRHPVSGFASSHPAFFSKGKAAGFTFRKESIFDEFKYVDSSYLVEIGSDVWIGDNVTIMDGIKIGNGSIIGTNSLVTRDVEPYTVCFGSPAKGVRKRFDEETIKFLMNFQWWERDFEWIKANSDYFRDISLFKKMVESEENDKV